MSQRLLATLLLSAGLLLRADEGMWTFDNPPLARIKAAYGFEPSEAWLEHLRLAALECGSASGSFVSKDGLVLTNHHVAVRYLEKVSAELARDGFVARARAEEIKVPDLRLYTLMQMVNVTEKVNAAVRPGMDEQQAAKARLEKLAKLRSDLDQRGGLLADSVSLYEGGEYWLYTYKVHKDVRLVMAPEAQIAFFGGDPDNFTFPRHDLDFALFRVYEGGEPYHPPHFLRWAPVGIQAGELTFVAGRPASTQRLETAAQMAYQRDVELPEALQADEDHRAVLLEYGRGSEARQRRVTTELFFTENRLKAVRGELEGLRDPAFLPGLQGQESMLRAEVAKDPALQAEAGGSWDRIGQAVEELRPLAGIRALVNSRGSRLLKLALDLVRCVQELDRPARERLAGYRTQEEAETAKWRLERQLPQEDGELETALIAKGLEDIESRLAPDHPFRVAVLGDRRPAELAREAVEGTKVQTMYGRSDLFRGGTKGIARSADPLVRLARNLESFRRELDRQREALEAILADHDRRIARARFKLQGRTFYPDATGTLRFSYGPVAGYLEEGRTVAPFTTFADLYDRARAKGPEAAGGAWALPERWKARKERLDLAVPLNFCHEADIIGGNSGSPVVNRQGELVGVVFDGNLQSLPGRFYYDGRVNRAVSLDARAIVEALVKVYDAKGLADELLSR